MWLLSCTVRKYLNYKSANLGALEEHIVGDAYLWVATEGKTIVEKGNALRKEVSEGVNPETQKHLIYRSPRLCVVNLK